MNILTDITNVNINKQIVIFGGSCYLEILFFLSHACIYHEIYFKIKLYLFYINYHFFLGSYVRYLKSIIFRIFQLSVVYFRLFANVQNKSSSDELVSEKNCVIAYC